MSEVASRPTPSRGRTSARGGRGGISRSSRNPARQTNGDHKSSDPNDASFEELGEIADMRKKYTSELALLKEMFADWTDVDLLFALDETDGDLNNTIERIAEGNMSQFSDVKKKTKDRSRSKVKEHATINGDSSLATSSSRSSRNKGPSDTSSRPPRGRSDRGRGSARGGRGGLAPSSGRHGSEVVSVPTNESSAWGTTPAPAETEATTKIGQSAETPTTWGSTPTATAAPAAPSTHDEPKKDPPKTWASMFATPKPVATPPKTQKETPQPASNSEHVKTENLNNNEAPAHKPEDETVAQVEVEAEVTEEKITVDDSAAQPEEPSEATTEETAPAASTTVTTIPSSTKKATDEQIQQTQHQPVPIPIITPAVPENIGASLNSTTDKGRSDKESAASIGKLTADNVEHLPDTSLSHPSGTAASTVASSTTSQSISHQQANTTLPRSVIGGFATTAIKATGIAGRSSSFSRRLQEQQEAVVLPGNHAIDRAAVQFGSLGLNGDSEALEIEDEREDFVTRAQPPQHSPVAQPRAALPPMPRQTANAAPVEQVSAAQEQIQQQTPKYASDLQTASQPTGATNTLPTQVTPQVSSSIQQVQAQQPPPQQQQNPNYSQFSRFGGPSANQATEMPQQHKSFDPFVAAAPSQSPFDQYATQAQQQQAIQANLGLSSAGGDYSNYYTTDHQRNAYQNYYTSGYAQQNVAGQQDAAAAASQGRSGNTFGANPNDTYSAAQGQQGRYNETQNSGHSTPNPPLSGPQHGSTHQAQQQHMHHPQNQYGGANPFGHGYYNNPYYAAYVSQYSGYQNYGAPYGKGGMYGQPHYGMNPQTSYDQHSSSPGNMGGFSQTSAHGRDGGMGMGLNEYGRNNNSTTQPLQSQQHNANSGFGSVPDRFGTQAGFSGQNQQYGQQQGSQQTGADDALKPFSDSKSSGGPTPSTLAQSARPGSATNATAGQTPQSGLPQSQSHQQGGTGFGGYPGHLGMQGQGNQYGGLGGLGHQGGQSHQSGYGAYGSGFGNYTGYRGGWGTNYSGH